MTYEIAERPTPANVRRMKAARLKEQGHRCAHCQRPISMASCHLDHIIPFSRGGSNLYGNMQALCEGCNLSKGNRMTREDFARGMVRNQAAAMRPPHRLPGRLLEYPGGWNTGALIGWAVLSFLSATFLVGRVTAETLTGPGRAHPATLLVPVMTFLVLRLVRQRRYGALNTDMDIYVFLRENDTDIPPIDMPTPRTRRDRRLLREHLVREGALKAIRESEEYLRSA